MINKLATTGVAAVLALTVSTTVPASTGPVPFDADQAAFCTSAALYPHGAFGAPIDYSGNKTIVISAVELIDPIGIELLSVSVVPYDDNSDHLGFSAYPPTELLAAEWQNRVEGIGFTAAGPIDAVLISEIQYTGERAVASIDGLIIHYTANGVKYVGRTRVAIAMHKGEDADECFAVLAAR
ncbi:hypothetical protein [Salinibacterium sp. M195]|uniref:hypothetical protein n=1 Tax=Salinibacterium sp. M195 TaxID=2583374 RepID=UPI001C63461A|nr:hypothetical protein [Salinibacterium sp. M195]QYH34975.1 hypothetical protein FFT87_02865 [Salinibacterium sp. M195]